MCISGGEHNSAYNKSHCIPLPKRNAPYTLLSVQDTRSIIARNSCCALKSSSALVSMLPFLGGHSWCMAQHGKDTKAELLLGDANSPNRWHQAQDTPAALPKISGQHVDDSTLPSFILVCCSPQSRSSYFLFPLPNQTAHSGELCTWLNAL